MDPTIVAKTPKFLRILYTILHTESKQILAWSACGSYFQIYDIAKLESHVLPRYFKHNKFVSFQRQLNNFGFHKWTKTRTNVCTFSHDLLVRRNPSELTTVNTVMTKQPPTMKRKRQREDESSTVCTTPLKKHSDYHHIDSSSMFFTEPVHDLSRDSAVEVSDLWALDWSVVYGEDETEKIFCEDEDDTVGLPLELFFPPEEMNLDLEPLPYDHVEVSIHGSEWQLVAECLAS
jgi:hypothetical protein